MTSKIVRRPKGALYVRITHQGDTRYASTGIRVPSHLWNESTCRVRRKSQHAPRVNREIEEIERRVGEVTMVASTAREAQRILKRALAEGEGDLFSWCRGAIKGYEKRGQNASAIRLRSIVNKAEAFADGPMTFADVTPSWIRAFEKHLREEVGNAPNTVAKNIKGLRALVYRAMREGACPKHPNPFDDISITEKPATKVRLLDGEIDRLRDASFRKGSKKEWARDLFMASYYAMGARFSDIATMKPNDYREGYLRYRMDKTGQDVTVKVTPPLERLIEKYAGEAYLFPVLDEIIEEKEERQRRLWSKNITVNRALAEITKELDLPEGLTFHCARHTFADKARRSGWDIYKIRDALGHSSVKQTEKYLAAFDQGALDKEMVALFT